MDSTSSYIKSDNDTFINEQNIVWVKQMNDCLKIATVETDYFWNTYKVCKSKNPHNYDKLYNKIKQNNTK